MIAVDARTLVAAIVSDPAALGDLRRALAEHDRTRGGLVSVATYAREREISQVTVRVAIREGRLACERIGRAVRIPHDAVIAPRSRVQRDARRARAERTLGIGGGR